ncbi:MAG: T9SS type A sorting domain-containing protein, partial [bacterium]
DVKAGQTHYYRLNQIDFDGKSAFSSVKSIKPGSIESNLNIYPNPSQGSFTVNTGSNSGKLNIFLMDNTGRVVNQFMNVSTSNTRINNLKKGFYTLKIVNTESGEQSAQRVVVQ